MVPCRHRRAATLPVLGRAPGAASARAEDPWRQAARLHIEGRYDKAVALYRRATERDPDHPAACNDRGAHRIELGRPRVAEP